jgi:hypothetical protein
MPSPGTILEQQRRHCRTSQGVAWMKGSLEIPELLEDLSKVLWAQALAGEYVDSHVWVFTPSRVRLLMLDLYELGFIRMREHTFFDSDAAEFHIQLSENRGGPPLSRKDLTIQALSESGFSA